MIRSMWTILLPAAIAVGGLMAICLAATPQTSGEADSAQKIEITPPPAKKPADAAKVQALVRKWKEVLAPWRKEDTPESADNSFCYVCHLNYDEENLVTIHQPVGVGCETCHGISDAHSEDEDNITPPDILFPTAQIIAFCMECHKKEDLLEEESHEELFAKDADAKVTCMKCHGEEHHLKVRTRRWDKLTGKLIWDDGVRMMEDAP